MHVLDADEPGKWCPAAPATVNASLPWALSPAEAAALAKEWRCPDRDAFARELVPWALARHPMCGESSCFTPLSHYRCFAVMTGPGGAIYFGVNIEVRESALATTLHAEQFASLLAAGIGARTWHETGLESLAQRGTGAPCAHCRQWLAEFANAPDLVLIGTAGQGVRQPMSDLFPLAFGPAALNNTCPLLAQGPACAPAGAA